MLAYLQQWLFLGLQEPSQGSWKWGTCVCITRFLQRAQVGRGRGPRDLLHGAPKDSTRFALFLWTKQGENFLKKKQETAHKPFVGPPSPSVVVKPLIRQNRVINLVFCGISSRGAGKKRQNLLLFLNYLQLVFQDMAILWNSLTLTDEKILKAAEIGPGLGS